MRIVTGDDIVLMQAGNRVRFCHANRKGANGKVHSDTEQQARRNAMLMITRMMSAIAGLVLMVATGVAYADYNAGMIKDVKGSATIERSGQKLAARPGIRVLVSDRVTTGADSSVSITLRDGTLLSAGQNSTLELNKFVFDSRTNKGALDASLKRGTLAVVSGKLSKTSSDAVAYHTPTSILGVRGTEFVLEAGAGKN
jgi:FecR protein